MAKKNKQRFKIDFWEFSFLVEACIPPRPIARAMFWDNVINEYYHELTHDERARLHEWVNRNPSMQHALEHNNEDAIQFNLRYDPDNQYEVRTEYKGKVEIVQAYKDGDRYYIEIDKWISPEFIKELVKTIWNKES
jgi:hypothetical protein